MGLSDHRVARRLEAGEVAYGVITAWSDPDLIEAAGACGFDYIFLDAEHGALDIRTCADLVRAADCAGMMSLIRIPYGDVRGVYSYLDLGAHGLIFPHVRSAADARAAAAACLFPPEGLRGAMSASRAARYGTAHKPADYFQAANAATWALPVIEDVEAVDALDEILSVPGIRGYFIGPGDLGLSKLTATGRTDRSVEQLVDAAIAAGRRAGKVVATVAPTPAAVPGLVEKGVRMVAVGATGLFTGACRGYLEQAPRVARRGA